MTHSPPARRDSRLRGHYMDTRCSDEELFGKERGGLNDVLTTVQHDEHPLGVSGIR